MLSLQKEHSIDLFCKRLVLTASCHHVSEERHYSSVYRFSNRNIVAIVKSKIFVKFTRYNFRLKANNSLNIMTDHPIHLSENSHKSKKLLCHRVEIKELHKFVFRTQCKFFILCFIFIQSEASY